MDSNPVQESQRRFIEIRLSVWQGWSSEQDYVVYTIAQICVQTV